MPYVLVKVRPGGDEQFVLYVCPPVREGLVGVLVEDFQWQGQTDGVTQRVLEDTKCRQSEWGSRQRSGQSGH